MFNENILTEIFNSLEIDKDESQAKAYGITNNMGILEPKLMDEDDDVYLLIASLNDDKRLSNTTLDYFSIISHGWAAPLNENGEVMGAPSAHPQRRRVRLIVSVDIRDNNVASILKFSDDDNLVFDFGSATGSLADAIMDLFE